MLADGDWLFDNYWSYRGGIHASTHAQSTLALAHRHTPTHAGTQSEQMREAERKRVSEDGETRRGR
jgi:hypothetical protein